MNTIFCDSNSELWHSKLKKYPIKLIRMPYTIDGQEYFYDMGEKTDFEDFYARVRAKSRPITSALNEQDYIDYFGPHFANGENILYISFSDKLSSTFERMDAAVATLSAKYPKAKFIRYDTQHISVPAGILVELAGEAFLQGKSNEEIIKILDGIKKNIKCWFLVDDLMHLKRGGRLSAGKAVMGTLLGIKPVLQIQNGKIVPTDKVKGRKNAKNYFIEKLKEFEPEKGFCVNILNADCEKEAKELAEEMKKAYPSLEIWEQTIGPVIATHCGPGTLGIAYVSKAKKLN